MPRAERARGEAEEAAEEEGPIRQGLVGHGEHTGLYSE